MSSPQIHIFTLETGAVTATNSQDWELTMPLPGTWKVLADKCYFCPAAASAADGSNFANLIVDDGTTEIAKWSTDSGEEGALVDGTPVVLGDEKSGKAVEIKQGERLRLRKTEGGTGVTIDGTFVVPMQKIRPA